MSVDREVVRHVAGLARLRVEDGEIDVLTRELQAIVDYVGVLSDLTAEGGEATGVARLRDDVVVPSIHAAALRAEAPATENDLLRVPRVVGESP